MYAPVTQMRASVEAGRYRLLHDAGVAAGPIQELEFDQTSDWCYRIEEVIVRAALRVRVRANISRRAAGAYGCGVLVIWWRWNARHFSCDSCDILELIKEIDDVWCESGRGREKIRG